MNSADRRRMLGEFYRGANHKPETLSDRNWDICVAYMERRDTIKDLAERHGISPSAVHQILDDTVLRHLKRHHFETAQRIAEARQRVYAGVRCTPEQMHTLIDTGHTHWRWLHQSFWERVNKAASYEPPHYVQPTGFTVGNASGRIILGGH